MPLAKKIELADILICNDGKKEDIASVINKKIPELVLWWALYICSFFFFFRINNGDHDLNILMKNRQLLLMLIIFLGITRDTDNMNWYDKYCLFQRKFLVRKFDGIAVFIQWSSWYRKRIMTSNLIGF